MKRVVGLDIGTSGIKATQASGGKIEKVATISLPAGAVDGGVVATEAVAEVADKLKQLWKTHKLAKDVVIGINSSRVSSHIAEIDKCSPAHLKAMARNIAQEQKILAVQSGDLEVDTIVLGEVTEDGVTKLRVFFIGVPLGEIDPTLQAAVDAGLNVVGADLNVLAGLRAVRTPISAPNSFSAVIDLGAELTTMILHENGVPQHISVLRDVGGNEVSRHISKRLGFATFEEGEQAKIDFTGETESGIKAANDRVSSAIATDVANEIEHYRNNDGAGSSLDSVVLIGNGSLLYGLADRIEQTLGVQTIPGSSAFGGAVKDLGLHQMVSAGLAIGAQTA